MFGILYVKQGWIDAEIPKAMARDPFGHRCHVLFGLIWCGLVSGPTSVVELGGAGLIATAVLRCWAIHRTWRSFGCHPLLWMLALWAAWQWWSISWSPDPRQGYRELGENRWVWGMWFLWTVLPYRAWFVRALVAGFLAANAAQVVHGIGVQFGIESLQFPRMPDRNAGWWQPVVGGSMLTGALGLHLPAAVMGAGRTRWLGLLGSIVTLAGIFATGTRGAWIAAAGLIGVVVVVGVVRWVRSSGGDEPKLVGRRLAVVVGAVLAAGVLTWVVAGSSIARRYELGREEVRRALEQQDYASDTGARILMWKWAIAEVRAHPVRGVGAGGFQAWAVAKAHAEGRDQDAAKLHKHAHSTPLHIAATTGVVGLGLGAAIIAMAAWGGVRGLGARMGTYAAGPAFAIVGLMLAGVFDVVQLNTQTAALLAVLMGLCIWPRPRER